MNRADLIEYIAGEMETSKAEADRFLSAFLDAIYSNVRKEGVKIAGLGSFSAAKRKARLGRNPQTGEEIKIPAKWVPVFKAGASLKEAAKKR
ncbi:MAG: HU family DNA-binding protein [Oligoflexales bacterium]|nr:HU family DNA-binding protein [Oligoflexales bacterium]